MADTIPFSLPTREELGKIFNDDQRTIRAFENLFKTTGEEGSTTIITGGNTEGKANQANSTAIESLQTIKGANVLLWLSM